MWCGEESERERKEISFVLTYLFSFSLLPSPLLRPQRPKQANKLRRWLWPFRFSTQEFSLILLLSLQQPSNRLPLIDDYQQIFFLSCRFPFYEWTARSSLSWKRFYFLFYFHSLHFQHSFTSMALMQALICVSFVGSSTNDGGRISMLQPKEFFTSKVFLHTTEKKPKSRSHSRRTHSTYIKLRCCLVTRKIIFSWSSLAFHFLNVRDAAIHHRG